MVIDSEIPDTVIDLRYATTNNFTGRRIYPDSTRAMLRPEALLALKGAAATFRQKGCRIVIWDAYRPAWAQAKLREAYDNDDYVSQISNHSRGISVDVTLAQEDGSLLEMGTGFDEFSEKAHSDSRDISDESIANRGLLVDAMRNAGFIQHPNEWWHFDYQAGLKWPIIEGDL